MPAVTPGVAQSIVPQLSHLAPPVPTGSSFSPGQDSLASRTNMFQEEPGDLTKTQRRKARLRLAGSVELLSHGGRHRLPRNPDCPSEVSLLGWVDRPCFAACPPLFCFAPAPQRRRRPIRFLSHVPARERQKTPFPSHPPHPGTECAEEAPHQVPPSPLCACALGA